MSRLFKWLFGAPRVLDLTSPQRQALMTWGMLLGIIVLCVMIAGGAWILESHWHEHLSEDLQAQLIKSAFRVIYLLIGLQALFAFGVVAIARGGALKMKVNREGVEIEAEATGAAARDLAKETSL